MEKPNEIYEFLEEVNALVGLPDGVIQDAVSKLNRYGVAARHEMEEVDQLLMSLLEIDPRLHMPIIKAMGKESPKKRRGTPKKKRRATPSKKTRGTPSHKRPKSSAASTKKKKMRRKSSISDPRKHADGKLSWNQFQKIHKGKNITSTIWQAYRNGEYLGGPFKTAELISFEDYKERREKYRKEASREEYDNWRVLVKFYNDNNSKAGSLDTNEDDDDEEGNVEAVDTGIEPKDEDDVALVEEGNFVEEGQGRQKDEKHTPIVYAASSEQEEPAGNEDVPSLRSGLVKRMTQPQIYFAIAAIAACLLLLRTFVDVQ